jgi:hypothetical protein
MLIAAVLAGSATSAQAEDGCKLGLEIINNRLKIQVFCRNKFVHRDSIKLWNENESCDESHLDELEKIDDPVGSPRALGGASIGPADR